jgi:hypothetical protein
VASPECIIDEKVMDIYEQQECHQEEIPAHKSCSCLVKFIDLLGNDIHEPPAQQNT